MDKLDRMIHEALDDEEREILEKIGQEQSFPKQALGLFKGRLGWLNGAILIGHLIFVVSGVYAAWQFFNMNEVLRPCAGVCPQPCCCWLRLSPGLPFYG